MIEKLQKDADSAFGKWVEENYSRENMIESIEDIAVRGFFKMSISTESSSNFSNERNMFIASDKFFEYVKSTLPEFNVYKEIDTERRYNYFKKYNYDVDVEYIIIDWSQILDTRE